MRKIKYVLTFVMLIYMALILLRDGKIIQLSLPRMDLMLVLYICFQTMLDEKMRKQAKKK
jgi:exosortase/archaeosortase